MRHSFDITEGGPRLLAAPVFRFQATVSPYGMIEGGAIFMITPAFRPRRRRYYCAAAAAAVYAPALSPAAGA